MKNKMPKIIHQIWGGENPLPDYFKVLSKTWTVAHPDWEYMFWDDEKIRALMIERYPQYLDLFDGFRFNMQRWDTIRYVILEKYGGVYADFDSECIKPIDKLIGDKKCWFSLEPDSSAEINKKEIQLSPAIMGAIREHPFINKVIHNIFSNIVNFEYTDDKAMDEVRTAGPLMLTISYENFPDKNDISIIPHDLMPCFLPNETQSLVNDTLSEKQIAELEKRIEKAYTIHYFFYSWLNDDK